jgi:predicted transcriptional regulator
MTREQMQVYRAALKEARASFDSTTKRLTEIASESRRLNREVGSLRRTITALAAMCSEEPWSDALGITESCVEAMESEPFELSTQEVVKKLEGMGFDMASQKNAPASVHAVLSRLAEKGKVQKITDDEKKTVSWRGPNYDPKIAEISDDDIPF